MAVGATMYHFEIALSDVDRGVYERLDLRLARHPSESFRYLVTRTLAYCLSYAEGIAFSKGGVSESDEPPVSIRDATGRLLAWIDVGSPSAERLHKASKAADSVTLYTAADHALLVKEAATRPIHKLDQIEVWRLDPALFAELEPTLDRNASFELVRTDGQLYLTLAGRVIESSITRTSLTGSTP